MNTQGRSLSGADGLYRAAQVRARDRAAIDAGGTGYALMVRAAAGALERLRERWPDARRLLVLCGRGNNGGDGLVLARLAAAVGLQPRVVLFADPAQLRGDAARAHADLRAVSVSVERWHEQAFGESQFTAVDVVVDGMFGTGLSRPIEGHLAGVISAVNASGRPVLALDCPSGVCSDTGAVLGIAVRAALTVTFVERKVGHYLSLAPDYVGALRLERLGIDAMLPDPAPCPVAHLLPCSLLEAAFAAPRRVVAHKGNHGHVLVLGGAAGMAGAARLAGEAALYAGAGLVTVATDEAHASVLNLGRPELMVHGVRAASMLAPLLERASVVVAGPGLGQGSWAIELLESVLHSDLPLLLDADGLNLLARDPMKWRRRLRDRPSAQPVVLTPHPGEAGRLLGDRDARAVQLDRLGAHAGLVERFGAVVVLKGAGSLVGAPGWLPHVCDRGNPGMAVAGMGDVLSGVIGALMAQAYAREPMVSACLGVLAHATAGDLAVDRQGGQRGLLAGELPPLVRDCLNGRGVDGA
ncbi:MAG: NAD(P)H-hydrate dehydratase [Pseudomonadota bacterium]